MKTLKIKAITYQALNIDFLSRSIPFRKEYLLHKIFLITVFNLFEIEKIFIRVETL